MKYAGKGICIQADIFDECSERSNLELRKLTTQLNQEKMNLSSLLLQSQAISKKVDLCRRKIENIKALYLSENRRATESTRISSHEMHTLYLLYLREDYTIEEFSYLYYRLIPPSVENITNKPTALLNEVRILKNRLFELVYKNDEGMSFFCGYKEQNGKYSYLAFRVACSRLNFKIDKQVFLFREMYTLEEVEQQYSKLPEVYEALKSYEAEKVGRQHERPRKRKLENSKEKMKIVEDVLTECACEKYDDQVYEIMHRGNIGYSTACRWRKVYKEQKRQNT